MDRSRKSCHVIESDYDSEEEIFAVESTSKYSRKLFAKLNIGDSLVRFQLDCGATVNNLSEKVAR